ncbi:MAG: 1-(5-phosphoribosyl)-5-[(5-phosphoribosylamino)methylideneamino]imidazole-4-carboxamide isomerase [Pseudomonadales bacterium]|nr:1-(5-phosphoribosyl)-5-[(5-phosphoribosylamino)methylideneamino]imidazole-4-carboxamide isomerase [Pseudomonadales bacterium]
MLIIPAIDLKDGHCVRLRQGRMDDSTIFSEDPVAMASHWQRQGARRLHLVDLNGAFAGTPQHAGVVQAIAQAYPNLPLQIGGGIRSLATIEQYLQAGVSWVILGTQALRQPELVDEACRQFPGHVMVGIDAKDGMVATEGWAQVSQTPALELAQRFLQAGISALIYTDISRDGMMQGVNVEATSDLARRSGLPVIASGGITSMDDIDRLVAAQSSGIIGAITGRAIYEGNLDLATAQQQADAS